MTKKIFNSIFFSALAVLLVSLIIVGSAVVSYFTNNQRNSLSHQTDIVEAEMNENGKDYIKGFSSEIYRLTWIDSDGTVLYDSMKDASQMENHSQREEIKQAFETGSGESERFSSTILKKTFYCARLLDDGKVIRLSVTKNSPWTILLGLIKPASMVLLITFVLSVFLSYRLSQRIVKPLENLDLENPLKNETYDELSTVLSKIDRQRRELTSRANMLKIKQDEFSAVTENMNEGLILVGYDGEVLSINLSAEKIFPVYVGLVGKNILTVDKYSPIVRVVKNALEKKADVETVEISGREYQISANPVMNGEKTAGACVLIFDVTQSYENEQMRREFTANVSHELKTPLHSILGLSELLKSGLVKSGDEKAFAERIYSESSRLVTLIDDVIRLSQLDEGIVRQQETVKLKAETIEVIDALKVEAQKKNVCISVFGDEVEIVKVKSLVYEIIFNLCDNAVRYNVENGTVKVEIKKTQAGAILKVSDSGIGIPEESLDRIFERFYRVDKSHSRQTGGTGLGLSIVKHACEYLGAKIMIQSELNKGTTVTVLFD